MTGLVYHDRIDIRRIKREDPFHTNTIGYLADRKAGGMAAALFFDHIAFKGLDPFFIAFNDLIVHGNIVTGLECGKILLSCQLLMYVGDGVHNSKFRSERYPSEGGQR